MLLLVLGTLPTASEALALPLACFAMAKRSVHPLTTACAASATSASPWLVNRFTALPRPLSEIWRSFPLHGVSRNRRSNTQSCAASEAVSSSCFKASNSIREDARRASRFSGVLKFCVLKFSFLGEGMDIRWASISAHWWMPTAETPNIYHPLQATPRYCSRSKCFKLHALAHIHYIIISQLQLKASLSLHCVPNRGLPFLVEMIVMKTARHEGRCMMNHFAKR